MLFGSPDRFHDTADSLGIKVLGELPLVPGVSTSSDAGVPYCLGSKERDAGHGGQQWRDTMGNIAEAVRKSLFEAA